MTSYGSYLSAGAIRANGVRIETISNNLANVETNGFKRALAEVVARPAEAAGGPKRLRRDPADAIGGGTFARSTRFDFSQGPIEPTDRALDMALQGPGFFVVRPGPAGGEGPVRLTRDGSLFVATDGLLVDHNGHAVLGDDGRPINLAGVPQRELTVDAAGVLHHRGLPVAAVAVRNPVDPAALRPTGGNLYDPAGAGFADLLPGAAAVRNSALEVSNVAPETELIRLLDAQRQLEANAKFLQFQDAATGKLVNDVGRIA